MLSGRPGAPVRVRLMAVRTTVAGVLLAAGEGSRFGRPKALVELNGRTLAGRGAELLRSGGADPILTLQARLRSASREHRRLTIQIGAPAWAPLSAPLSAPSPTSGT